MNSKTTIESRSFPSRGRSCQNDVSVGRAGASGDDGDCVLTDLILPGATDSQHQVFARQA
jgi:hypothetical protein